MLKLTMGIARDPRIAPLIDGSVRPQNIDLEFVLTSPGELHYRNLKYDEFDVFQMSISESIIASEIDDKSKWQWSGLPVFPSKAFIWLNMFVNADSGIKHLDDLKGRRVGVPDYPMTAALWMRVFLKELCGINPSDISWYNGRTKKFSHGVVFGLDQNPPPGVSLQWLTEEQTLDVMLERGELDAAFGFPPRHDTGDFGAIDRYGGTLVSGNPRIRQLFADGGREIVTEYYRKTGVLPSNHLLMVQNRILEKHPWVSLELYKAFEDGKQVAYQRASAARSAYLMFDGDDYNKQREIFGEDPYPFGIRKNRKMLQIIFGESFEEGLTKKPAKIEKLFCPTLLDT